MLKKLLQTKYLLLLILIFTLLTRLFHFAYPNGYIFDEVYHAFTAKQYLIGSKNAWDPWAIPPKGVAYEWTHPPLAKEIMAVSMFIFNSTDAWAWRLPGILFGVLSVFLISVIAFLLFENLNMAVLCAFLFSLDGLSFVESRTGMNDIYFLTFLLVSLLFFIKKRFIISAIFLGLSLSSKWSALYMFPVYILLLFFYGQWRKIPFFLIIPLTVYILSYIPYFLLGFDFNQFLQLQQQMWWYHTSLKATHDYTSPWWSWPLNLYPVWYFVDYTDGKIGNIFASGNLLLALLGIMALLKTCWDFIKKRQINLAIILLGYFVFWLPWAFSPRVMFLYHYTPSMPFLCLSLAFQLNKLLLQKKYYLFYFLLVLVAVGFLLTYPFLVAIPLPKDILQLFFLTNLTKNPF